MTAEEKDEGRRTPTPSEARDKGLELLVSTEYLPMFETREGAAAFGRMCEMVGRCLQLVAEGRYSEAVVVAARVDLGPIQEVDEDQRERLLSVYGPFLSALEGLSGAPVPKLH